MINIWKHKYPSDLSSLLLKSTEIAATLKETLNADSTPSLNELYKEINGKVYRQESVFDTINATPNRRGNKKVKSDNELMGLYVFGIENEGNYVVPVYIGISRTVYRRLRQHGWGKTHNQCTFAYLLANEKHFGLLYDKSRIEFCKDQLEESRTFLQDCKVAIYPIPKEQHYEMYFHEVAIAGILKTKYNTFKTH